MPYVVQLEPGEQLLDEFSLTVSPKVEPFHFAISDRALFLPGKKWVAVSDPYYYRRVPHPEVMEVAIRRLPPYFLWSLAALMLAAGLVTTSMMIWAMANPTIAPKLKVSGWPVAICVGSLLMPFAAHGRKGLVIRWASGRFRWKPPLVVDRESKRKIADTLSRVAAVCRQAQLDVTVEESGKSRAKLAGAK